MSDQNTRTALDLSATSRGQKEPPEELLEFEGTVDVEEKTIQGASFLVERITPIPPTSSEAQARLSREHLHDLGIGTAPTAALPSVAPLDAPTAAVQNPGSYRPAHLRPPEVVLPGQDAPPDIDTAYVALPSPAAGAPLPSALSAQSAPPPAPGRPLPAFVARAKEQAAIWSARIKGSKNARLAILAGGGCLGLLLTFIAFSPRPRNEPLPEPAVTEAVPAQEVKAKAPPPPAQADPAALEERDQLLERAILAVEAGHSDEALASFRRYAEDQPDTTAEYMVQLLQTQITQTGKDRQ